MEKLKIGDKLCNISHERWGGNIYYNFDEVERLTKTQAILKSGIKLINEPKNDYYDKCVVFETYGDRWVKWKLPTEEIIEASKAEKYRQSVNNWFHKQKFNQEQIIEIYKLFNK